VTRPQLELSGPDVDVLIWAGRIAAGYWTDDRHTVKPLRRIRRVLEQLEEHQRALAAYLGQEYGELAP